MTFETHHTTSTTKVSFKSCKKLSLPNSDPCSLGLESGFEPSYLERPGRQLHQQGLSGERGAERAGRGLESMFRGLESMFQDLEYVRSYSLSTSPSLSFSSLSSPSGR